MGMPEYCQVIEAFCKKSGIADVESVLNQGAIIVHGTSVWLQYFEPADLCRIIIDLGAPETGIPPEIWQSMLQFNCINHSNTLPFMAINPLNGHAILILHLTVSRVLQEENFPNWLDEQLSPAIKNWLDVFDVKTDATRSKPNQFGSAFV